MKLTLGQVSDLLASAGVLAIKPSGRTFDSAAVATGYSIDSRTISPGELFFAVHGEKLDGHDYVAKALAAGAVAAVVEETRAAEFGGDVPVLVVKDSLVALQELAKGVRRIWGKPVVGVTGSAGKTTTKELVARVLAAKYKVLKSEGNLNNHFGMPLQVLKLEPEHEIAVFELGMSHAGEITRLAEIAQPNTGVVTMVAPVHIEFFDSIAGIAKAKKELVDALPSGSTSILNADDEHVSQFARDFNGHAIFFGINGSPDVRAENVQALDGGGVEFEVASQSERAKVRLPLIGAHNVYNALAAISTGIAYGVSLQSAADALAHAAPGDKRGEVLQIAGATVINDCYNSNPKALKSMIDALAAMQTTGRRIVVAGEMLELGEVAPEMHRECGEYAAERGIDVVIGVRGVANMIAEGARPNGKVTAEFLETPQAAGEWLSREAKPGDLILLKASRGVRLEGALKVWQERTASVTAS